MIEGNRLDAYHFYEEVWDSYDQLCSEFEWEIPNTFNIATYACDRWAEDMERVALFTQRATKAGLKSRNKTDSHTDASNHQRTYTYQQLQTDASRLADYFHEQGIRRGDRIGINLPQRAETIVAHLACWKLGAVSVPLSTLFGPEALHYRLDDCDASAAIVDESNVENFRDVGMDTLTASLIVGEVETSDNEEHFWKALDGRNPEFGTITTSAEDDALLVYTSGTTGDPKGVCHAHRVLLGHLPLFIMAVANMEIKDSDVYWTPSDWGWIGSLFTVVMSGLYYGKPIFAYNGEAFDPEAAFELIGRNRISNLFAPPTALRMMMRVENLDRFDLDSIRTIATGGESIAQTTIDWVSNTFSEAAVNEGYGQTEASMLIGGCTALMDTREGLIGRAAPGHEVTLVDPQTGEQTISAGEVGEIAVRYQGDPVCFKKYWNEPEKTTQKVQDGWLLTGDLGTVDDDGYFAFKSRKDDIIISAGYRIGPEEVENNVAEHDAVADAAVIGIPHEERGEVPKAFVVLNENYGPSEQLREEIKQYVKQRQAPYKYPREVEFVSELPKTVTGKVRRTLLREDQ